MSVLFIDAQHGLCNRLRAMSSAASVAKRTGRELVVIWRPDAHCEARLSDLLDYAGPVIETDHADQLRARCGRIYNYMEIEEGSCHEAPILDGSDRDWQGDVYVRSAYPLKGLHVDPEEDQRFLLGLRPTQAVQELVSRVAHPFDVAAHIRMAGGPQYDHLAFEAPTNWPEHRHRELTEWRQKSHRDVFIHRLDGLMAKAESLFVAADLPETYDILAERYGTKLVWLERDLYDRSPRQLQYALADLLLLASARHLLGSTWSSFSDMAARLARPGQPFERSGIDFGISI